MRFVGWLAIGLVIYIAYGYRHSRLRHPRPLAPTGVPPDFNPEQQLPEKDVE
jgi:hypothetical protein